MAKRDDEQRGMMEPEQPEQQQEQQTEGRSKQSWLDRMHANMAEEQQKRMPPMGMMGEPQMMQPQGIPGMMPPAAQGMGATINGADMALRSGAKAARGDGTGSIMSKERLQKAQEALTKYKAGKKSVEDRIIKNQQWWKLHNWEQAEQDKGLKGSYAAKGSTAWLWNAIVGKHAEYMDSYPEPNIVPREQDDKDEARKLTDIIPVVLKMNNFEDTYSHCGWQKLQEGTGCYGVFWDASKMNGLGDIDIQQVNLLNLFWEPGVMDIQDSQYVFLVHLELREDLERQYPEYRDKLGADAISVSKYIYDDNVDTSDKCLVVDWYYHMYNGDQKTLHLCKYCNDQVLYCTEDDVQMGIDGLYKDGNYPFILDPMYPVQGSPCGYGLIDIAKDTQVDIDVINQALVQNTAMCSTPRYFTRKDGGINEEEFADFTKPLVHVSGNLGADSVTPVVVQSIQGNAISLLQQKVEEMKFITGNSDINNGTTPSGVTSGVAIAALKEDAGRASKDSNRSTYRAFRKVINLVIERIRQFYDLPRQFRILGSRGQEEFVEYDNSGIMPQHQGVDFGMDMGYRLPVFDIDVTAEKENSYTKMAQNELAIQLYQLGVFNPQQVDMSMMLLDMMDFSGKDELQQKLQQMGTMQQMLLQFEQIALGLAQQYEPGLAVQIANMVNGMAGGMAQMGAGLNGANAKGGVIPGQDPIEAMTKKGQETPATRHMKQRMSDKTQPG